MGRAYIKIKFKSINIEMFWNDYTRIQVIKQKDMDMDGKLSVM